MEISTEKMTTWPKEWVVPEEAKTIRLDDKNKIEIPYIIKDRVLLKEGEANGLFYPGEEIEPNTKILNEKPDLEDIAGRNRTSIFWDHDDACKNWLGEIKNFRWDPKAKALLGDIYLVDEDAAKKTHYQLQEDMSRWGISPRVRIDERDGRATNIQFVTFALVMEPAGGPKLMLEQEKFDCECTGCGWKITSETPCAELKCEKCEGQMQEVEKSEEKTQDEEPYVAWVCKKCSYSEAVEKDEEKEKTKECPKCKGEMEQKQEAKGSLEELYTDLELEPEEETKKEMEFSKGSQANEEELLALSEEFGLTLQEISKFSEEQLKLLRNTPAETVGNPRKTYKRPPEKEARKMFVCPRCGIIESLGGKTEKECPRCAFPMEIKEIKDETSKELAGDKVESVRKRIESFAPLLKIDLDEHIVKMVVLEPEVVDNYGHLVSAEEIRNAMFMWMEHYRNCEVMHRDKAGNLFPLEKKILSPEDEAWRQGWNEEFAILECYQAPMDYFENDQVVRKDSWILTLRVKDEEIWQKIKNKELTGASIGGHGALASEVVA